MTLPGFRKWYSTLFFIGIAVPFFRTITAECPPAILITPCTCDDVLFTLIECGGITDMETLVEVFEKAGDRTFPSFALYNSTVQYLPASAISDKKFEQIMLVNVTMTAMFDTKPDVSNNISMITVMGSKFLRGVGWENFGNMNKLQIISIQDTEVKSLGKSFVDNIGGSVQILDMLNTGVRKLQYNAFSRMAGLYNLLVHHGGIKVLKRSMFPTPSIIKNFEFPGNQIETLPDDLFTEMPDMEAIDLSGNNIKVVSETVFGDIYNKINNLQMESNPVVCDCKLRWYMSRNRRTLKGNCAGPEDRKGRSFQNLGTGDFTYCS